MSIKIIGHPSLASDLYVKMSQLIQEIDMPAVAVCKAGDEIVLASSQKYSNHVFGQPGPLSAILIQETPYDKKKNSLENFRDWRLIRENRESFPPRTICIIR